ncbi:ATP-binding cassette domain-containing protein [Arcanobacterium haemolyticum]|nr:ATP-binding cassette domain-containing protein [Arcanobacterium haemolyticum]
MTEKTRTNRRKRRPSFKKVVLSATGRRDIKLVAAGRLFSALSTGTALVATALIIDDARNGLDIDLTRWVLPLLAALLAACGAFFEIWFGGRAARNEERRIRHRLLETVFRSSSLPKNNEGGYDPGKLITLMTDNAERVTEYRQVYFGATMAAMAIPFVTLIYVAIFIDPIIGIVLLLFCPLIPFLIAAFMRLFRKTSANSRKERGKLAGQYLDAIRNLVTIRLFGAGPRIEAHLREQGERNRGAIMKLLAGNQIVIIVMDGLFSLLLICCAVFLTVARIHAGAVSLGEGIAVIFLTVLLIEPLVQVAGFFYIGMGGMASERAIGSYLSSVGQRSAATSDAKVPQADPGAAIDVRGVSFDYGRGEVLHSVDLTVPQGHKVAIVGRSGAGKSTLLSLLRGSLPLQQGAIAIDGIEIAECDATEIRTLTASVSQSTWLFTGTIADNLRLAAPQATEDEMWAALRLANIADEIERMPRGLATDVGEQGVLISGGQAQRISLARAFLSGRRTLLLDEPTSQVDIESEQKIIEAIGSLGPEWNILMVTHRRSLLAVADEVWEMTDGKLVELEESAR